MRPIILNHIFFQGVQQNKFLWSFIFILFFWNKCFYITVATCEPVHNVESINDLYKLLKESGNLYRNVMMPGKLQFLVTQASFTHF